MKQLVKILVRISALLIISGMMLHEAIPHHHHSSAGEVHSCCEPHEHSDTDSNDELPCNILTNIQFENHKPQIQVQSQDLKRNHSDHHFDACEHCFEQHSTFALLKTPIHIPQSVFIEKEYLQSFSFRGPPLA